MDIKLIRNFEGGVVQPISENMILEITDTGRTMAGHPGKSYALIDIDSNVKQIIKPDVEKYVFYDFKDVTSLKSYVYFTTAYMEKNPEDTVKVDIIRYSIKTGECAAVHSAIYRIDELKMLKVNVVIADEDYLFIQEQLKVSKAGDEEYTKLADVYLYNIAAGSRIEIKDPRITGTGIEHIIPVDGNICAIKTGFSNIQYRLNGRNKNICNEHEIIGFVNFRQFISDIVLGKEELTIDIIDESSDNKMFPHMRLANGSVLYSRADYTNKKDEIVVYDYASKISKVRMNDHITSIEELVQTYIISDTMYYLQKSEKDTKLINLNTQKCEWKLSQDYKIIYIKNDIIVLSHHKKGLLFAADKDIIQVYRYPDIQNPVFKERAVCSTCMMENDTLMIFCE